MAELALRGPGDGAARAVITDFGLAGPAATAKVRTTRSSPDFDVSTSRSVPGWLARPVTMYEPVREVRTRDFYGNGEVVMPVGIAEHGAEHGRHHDAQRPERHGFAALRRLADSEQHIVPGHDPLVLQRYPAASAELKGIVARLDLPPVA